MKNLILLSILVSSNLFAGSITITEHSKKADQAQDPVMNTTNPIKGKTKKKRNSSRTDEVKSSQSSTTEVAQSPKNSVSLDAFRSNIVDYTNTFDVL